ncbi:MAG: hypothetical protein QG608_1110 [Actinomycetota bacterium]|nr:hypothetical protein [Actinomycetota bacterium]
MGETVVDRVASRFHAAAVHLGGATEVVTGVRLTGAVPDAEDVAAWLDRHPMLAARPRSLDGYLTLVSQRSPRPVVRDEPLRLGPAPVEPLDAAVRRELELPLAGRLWRLTVLPSHDGDTTLLWRRDHLVSDATTTDQLLADLLENARGGRHLHPRSWFAPGLDQDRPRYAGAAGPQGTRLVSLTWHREAACAVDRLRAAEGVSVSALLAGALVEAGDFPTGSRAWVAYSRRKALGENRTGCFIGVRGTRVDREESLLRLAADCHREAVEASRSTEVTYERYADSVRAVLDDRDADLGPCVTNSGAYPRTARLEDVDDVMTCVDRRHGNYSLVAHVDRFRGRLRTTLVAPRHRTTQQQLEELAVRLVNTAGHPSAGHDAGHDAGAGAEGTASPVREGA